LSSSFARHAVPRPPAGRRQAAGGCGLPVSVIGRPRPAASDGRSDGGLARRSGTPLAALMAEMSAEGPESGPGGGALVNVAAAYRRQSHHARMLLDTARVAQASSRSPSPPCGLRGSGRGVPRGMTELGDWGVAGPAGSLDEVAIRHATSPAAYACALPPSVRSTSHIRRLFQRTRMATHCNRGAPLGQQRAKRSCKLALGPARPARITAPSSRR
jgi:hypothetical protein